MHLSTPISALSCIAMAIVIALPVHYLALPMHWPGGIALCIRVPCWPIQCFRGSVCMAPFALHGIVFYASELLCSMAPLRPAVFSGANLRPFANRSQISTYTYLSRKKLCEPSDQNEEDEIESIQNIARGGHTSL